MTIWDSIKKWKQKRKDSQAENYGKTLETLMTIKDQRLEAIEGLYLMSPEVRAPQLIRRFKISIDHAIQDKKEKERIQEILIETPEASREPVKHALKTYPQIGSLIGIAQKVFSEDEYVDLLIEEVNPEFVSFDDDVQEKNSQILLALKETKNPKALSVVEMFLYSRDENLRASSLDLLEIFCQKKNEQALNTLKSTYSFFEQNPQDKDENPRIFSMVESLYQNHFNSKE
jgi:hypothetical protein